MKHILFLKKSVRGALTRYLVGEIQISQKTKKGDQRRNGKSSGTFLVGSLGVKPWDCHVNHVGSYWLWGQYYSTSIFLHALLID